LRRHRLLPQGGDAPELLGVRVGLLGGMATMTAIRWMSGVLAALRRRGPTRSQLRGRVRFLEQARDGMRDGIRSHAFDAMMEQERDGLRAQVASLQGPRQPHRQKLIRIAQQLRRWSDESHAGGWSTHLCGPMEALAAQIYQHIGSATGISHEQMLRDVSRHLMRWSNESMTGGWSTQHQVGAAAVRVREGLRALHGPMRALASRIEVGIEAATRPPSCVEYWDGWPA